jgi:heptosyltransferase-2
VFLTYFFSPWIYLLTRRRKKGQLSRFLVIQEAKIGDLICSTPVFREIKQKYPQIHLTVMVNPITREILEFNPYVDQIQIIYLRDFKGLMGKWRLSKLIRKGRYDVAICLNPNIPFAVGVIWGLVPIRISILPNFRSSTFKLISIFFTHLEKHDGNRLVTGTYLRALKAIGIESDNLSREIYKSPDADQKVRNLMAQIRKPIVGIAVSSGNKLKEIGAEKTADLITMILEHLPVQIVLIGSEGDKPTSRRIRDQVPCKDHVLDAAGLFNLKEIPALLARCALFIGVDSGITYMADALSIPVIDIAGPANMIDQRPIGVKAIIIQKQLPCSPCSHVFRTPYHCRMKTRECISRVSIAEVVERAGELITNGMQPVREP